MPESAEYKKAKASYGVLVDHFAFYASYHNNNINKWIHIICVPMIVMTAVYMLSFINLSTYIPDIYTKLITQYTGFGFNAATVVGVCYMIYYLYLSTNLVGVLASLLIGICYYIGSYYYVTMGDKVWNNAVTLHVVCWIAQFYGHGIHEGRSPALFDNLFQALFISPLFIVIEVLIIMGFLHDFEVAITPVVNDSIAKWKASKAESNKKK